MRDLVNPTWMYVKAGMFLVIGFGSAILLLLSAPSAQNCFLLLLTVWSFCRAYYFAFYVIEKYTDPTFKFSGLGSAVKYILTKTKAPNLRS